MRANENGSSQAGAVEDGMWVAIEYDSQTQTRMSATLMVAHCHALEQELATVLYHFLLRCLTAAKVYPMRYS